MALFGRLSFAAVALLLLATAALAAPSLINYQGALTEAGGLPVAGTVTISFALFDAAEGGTEQWGETQSVTVQNGAYHVLLGSVSDFPDGLFTSGNLWLELTIGAETLAPRQLLASVPYAISAQSAGCNPGDFIYCFNADPAAIDVGLCKAGKRFCLPDGSGFGDCTGSVLPVSETCNLLDDDCNGQLDDNASDASIWYADRDRDGYGDPASPLMACLQPGGSTTDTSDCRDSDATVYPGAHEICDGLDNNCNGPVDDDCTQPPACSEAERLALLGCYDQECVNNSASTECIDAILALQSCGLPFDCISIGDACYLEHCPDQYQYYMGALPPECSFGSTRTCGTDVGECQAGTETCGYGGVWTGICEGALGPGEEICGNGLDDDCDGLVDNPPNPWCPDFDQDGYPSPEGCVNDCTPPAYFIAASGLYDCDDSDPTTNPGSEELCDGIDNNCNGQTDEDLAAPACANQAGVCSGAVQSCDGFNGWQACTAQDYSFFNPDYEVSETSCDGLDNNCNGQVDEGCCGFDKSGGETASISAPDASYQAQDTSENTLNIEMWGTYTGPGSFQITNADYSTCAVCVLIHESGKTFLADSGTLELTDSNPIFAGSITGANLVEVTINPETLASTPVPAGETRCLNNYTFSVNTDPLVDVDGDGAYSDVDCDDTDPNNYPGNTEVCDGQDNDCSGAADFPGELVDMDADGVLACADCEDFHPNIFPGNVEICDGADNDCDSVVDNNLIDASPCANQVGVCAGAMESCGGLSGWQVCTVTEYSANNASYEVNETTCDGRDNDCDGVTDEGCSDSDEDGIPDNVDNCPGLANTDQLDVDFDGLGDACDTVCNNPTDCPGTLDLVCGADNITYPNACEAAAVCVAVAYAGECIP